MPSLLRIAANRANAAKSTGPRTPAGKRAVAANAVLSTGPRTPAGKARSSRNAVKHGLLAQTVVLPSECARIFESSLAALREELQPRTYLERRFVEIMAVADWRRQRVWHIEMAQFTHAINAQEALADPVADQENSEVPAMHTALAFGSLCEGSGVLKTLHRYEVRFSREFTRHLLLYEFRRGSVPTSDDFSKQSKANPGELLTAPGACTTGNLVAGAFTESKPAAQPPTE